MIPAWLQEWIALAVGAGAVIVFLRGVIMSRRRRAACDGCAVRRIATDSANRTSSASLSPSPSEDHS